MIQAEDRAHRIGQVNPVTCHYLIGEGTMDEILYNNLEKKMLIVS
jgi:SWI/SNF-related matrix-associated actin-dependent regulator 1 of chromatin subfamily A